MNEPDKIDAPIDKALSEFDYDTAYDLMRGVQDFVVENGQFGRHIAYNYVVPALSWNYRKMTYPADGEGWSFLSASLWAHDAWIDTDDPTWEGAGQPTPTPL